MRSWVGAGVLGAALLAGSGSGCAKAKFEAKLPEVEPQLHLIIRGDEDSNGGHALQVVVRAVSEVDFREDSYSDIAALVENGDDSVLKVLTVFPGEVVDPILDEIEELPEAVGIYGMFNDTSTGRWKLWLTPTPGSWLGLARENTSIIEVAAGANSLVDMNEDLAPSWGGPAQSAVAGR